MRLMCQICQERLESDITCGPCGHTFHHDCCMRWLRQSSTCPICRNSCSPSQMVKLFFDKWSTSEDDKHNLTMEDVQVELESCRNEVQDKERELNKRDSTIQALHDEIATWEGRHQSVCSQLREEQSIRNTLTKQISAMDREIAKKQRVEAECQVLSQRLSLFENVEAVIRSNKEEVAEMMHKYRGDSSPAACNNLATCLTMLKNEYELLKSKKKDAVEQKNSLQRELSQQKLQGYRVEMQLKVCQGHLTEATNDISLLQGEREGLHKKIKALEQALVSPGSKSKLTRILESPLPERMGRLFLPGHEDSERNKRVVLETPQRKNTSSFKQRDDTHQDSTSDSDDENKPPILKSKQMKLDVDHRCPITGNDSAQSSKYQVQRKIAQQDTDSQFVRKGYNGFGGHSKVRLKRKLKNSVLKQTALNQLKHKATLGKPPPLPSLSVPSSSLGYIDLD
ncbi:E3 ubiquitin-protein ligase TRAIP-like [Corticium candelabrum]|uniref:E3 ubiquitin-protein ligase TRAIP-like n=1 Tax=Corticium candelabrum TaxID=121492 RepID=UPI002E25F221|nr:E3 ubiquitin-protein ligase TRAIP-like [Corticium candelabrum]